MSPSPSTSAASVSISTSSPTPTPLSPRSDGRPSRGCASERRRRRATASNTATAGARWSGGPTDWCTRPAWRRSPARATSRASHCPSRWPRSTEWSGRPDWSPGAVGGPSGNSVRRCNPCAASRPVWPSGPLAIALYVLTILVNWSLQFINPLVAEAGLAQWSVGRHLFGNLGRTVNFVPLVSTIYPAVKQVATSPVDRDSEYESGVLVEYPREGVYSIGLVTSEGRGAIDDFVGASGRPDGLADLLALFSAVDEVLQ
ncbi:hypothetical protein BRC78_05330, partial [Halobacteriales archaeon QH_8_68_33]